MTSPGFNVRRGNHNDAEFLACSAVGMLRDAEGKEVSREVALAGVQGILQNEHKGFYVVAERGGELAGSLLVAPLWQDLINGCYWWLQCIYVVPAFRKQGCLRAMYAFTCALGQQNEEVKGLRLRVHEGNQAARAGYEGLGMSFMPYAMYQQRFTKPANSP